MNRLRSLLYHYRSLALTTILVLLVGTAITQTRTSGGLPTCYRCNVILISIDTLSAKHLGLYGYSRPTTPNLDQIAKESGIVFSNAIVQAPWTLPSHTAMLTSRYPYEYNVWAVQDALPDNAKTIAQAMKERGYQTKAFSNGPFVQPEWGFDRGFDSFSGSIRPADWHDSPTIFQSALEWTKVNSKKPFFLFVHSFDAHLPYHPTAESLAAMGAKSPYTVELSDVEPANARPTGPTKEEDAKFELAYDAGIRDVDGGLKTFFDGLRSQGLLSNTMVILVADHGEGFGEHGIAADHITMNEEIVHVPLVLFLPHAAPSRVSAVTEIRAIPPTILKLSGLPAEKQFSSRTLVDTVTDKTGKFVALTDSSLQKEEVVKTVGTSYDKAIALFGTVIKIEPRQADWDKPYAISARSQYFQLIKNTDGQIELYDLRSDPFEANNIYDRWANLPAEDRQLALPLLNRVGGGVPIQCGLYCLKK